MIGIAWRNGFVRCCSDCFDKPYLISEIKRSSKNIIPVVVLDINTKKTKCYMINNTMTDFDDVTVSEPVICRRVEGIADWMINKKNIQKSNLTKDEKETACIILEKRDYNRKKISAKESKTLKDLESKINA